MGALHAAGFTLDERAGADDRVLAWIDETFGGSWSGEVFVAHNAIVRRDGDPVGFVSYDPVGLRFAWLRGVAAQPGVGVFGPFGVERSHRGGIVGASLLTIALCALRERGFRAAVIPAITSERLVAYYALRARAREVESFDTRAFVATPVRTAVLASGNGSNLQTVLDRVADGTLPLEIVAFVTNRAQAFAIERARRAGIARIAVEPWNRKTTPRASYDAHLRETLTREAPELVLLLGWMHLLDTAFVTSFSQMLNIHPAFLPLDPSRDEVGLPDGSSMPAFRGAHAVADALAMKSAWVGASVHRVTSHTDRGPILVRKPMRVGSDESEADVLARLHPIEHELVERGVKRWLYER